MNELRRTGAENGGENLPTALIGQQMTMIAAAMQDMAAMVRACNERMGALEAEVKRLTKVTPAQAREINQAIRTRAAELCQSHRAAGMETQAASAIRKAVRLTCGISSVRELPRGDYGLAIKQIGMWDDYKQMRALRLRAAEGARDEQDHQL